MKKKTANKFSLPLFNVIKDIRNYINWIQVISKERDNKDSKFNKFNLDHNFFYILYLTITLPLEDKILPDPIKRLRVVETLKPIHQYLDEDLGFADYITPEFNQFFDEEDEPTLTYGIIYRFTFKYLSLKWVLTRTIFLSIFIYFFVKYNMFNYLINLI